MANKEVRLNKTVFDREQFDKVIDRNFSTFAQPIAAEDIPTIEEFFNLYQELFYEIPIQGSTQSHEYLVKKSSELVSFEKDTEDIQPLLDEIAQLRETILAQQEEIIQLSLPAVD